MVEMCWNLVWISFFCWPPSLPNFIKIGDGSAKKCISWHGITQYHYFQCATCSTETGDNIHKQAVMQCEYDDQWFINGIFFIHYLHNVMAEETTEVAMSCWDHTVSASTGFHCWTTIHLHTVGSLCFHRALAHYTLLCSECHSVMIRVGTWQLQKWNTYQGILSRNDYKITGILTLYDHSRSMGYWCNTINLYLAQQKVASGNTRQTSGLFSRSTYIRND